MSKHEENSKKNKENNPFSLPEGYFGSFGKRMMHKIELAEELKEFPVLSSIDKKLSFVTPENYFAASEVKTELSAYPKLSAVKHQNVFAVPDLYFESSAKAIKARVEVAEELKVYPALYSINKENNFATPHGYFEGSGGEVHAKISGVKEEETRILHLVFSRKTAYAIAALLVISFGIYFYNSGEETADCNGIACLDKNEIMKSEFIHSMDEDALIQIVNIEKLSKGLQENLKEDKKEQDEDKKAKEDYVLENVDVNDIVDEI